MSKSIESIEVHQLPDPDPDISWLSDEHRYDGCTVAQAREYAEQDRDRVKAFNAGEWHMVGVRAEATIIVNDVRETITSPGLWNIESDSDDSHFKEVGGQEIDTLYSMLVELGFPKPEVRKAILAEGTCTGWWDEANEFIMHDSHASCPIHERS